jgi:dCMP deaminase
MVERVNSKWDLRFMHMVDSEIATWSKDRSRRIGAVIVKDREIVTTGYNGMPRGVDDEVEERHQRPEKYHWFIHAEANAIINCARQGKCSMDSDIYVNLFPCDTCAGFIVQAGIKRVFVDKEPDFNDPKFGEGFKRALVIFEEGGVEVIYMNYDANR